MGVPTTSVSILAGMQIWEDLSRRIHSAHATVGVLGLGYVGLPLATAFARKGFSVIGFDISPEKVAALQAGQSYVMDVSSTELGELMSRGSFTATDCPSSLHAADVLIICVPTPCKRNREPDLSFIEQASALAASVLRPGQLVILESTTYPGTTEEVMVPHLLQSGLRLDEDFLVAFSPERIDPGNPHYTVENTPKIVGGLGMWAGELASAVYEAVTARVVRVSSPREAEMAKLVENTFRHVNIALANELAMVARKMGIDIWQTIEAAASKPFGFMPFFPGPGVGGHCIPIDPHYLSWKAREHGCDPSFIELAERINHSMPEYVVRLVIDAVNRGGRSIRGARVLLLGMAYKRDIDDLRESPALAVFEQLHAHGALVDYVDPYIPHFCHQAIAATSKVLTSETLQDCDCAVILTDHSAFDPALIAHFAPQIVDTRNFLQAFPAAHITRL